jgi:hypothetical protein
MKLSFTEKIAFRYFITKSKPTAPADEWYILNESEKKVFHNTFYQLLVSSAIIGALGIILYYLPLLFFPEYFPPYLLEIKGEIYKIPLISNVYSLILAIIEVVLLTILNLAAVHNMAQICGFPDPNEADFQENIAALAQASLESKDKRLLHFGINPFYGVSKVSVFLLTTLNLLKAFLSNLIIKIIFRRFLGRVILRVYIDLIGAPVYAFWNAYSAYIVFSEAKIRILSTQLIQLFCKKLAQKYAQNADFKLYMYDMLHYIATSKRRFHYTQAELAEQLLLHFEIPIQSAYQPSENLLLLFQNAKPEIRKDLVHIIMFGMIIDGRFLLREKRLLQTLQNQGLTDISIEEVKKWLKGYLNGESIPELLQRIDN